MKIDANDAISDVIELNFKFHSALHTLDVVNVIEPEVSTELD